MFALGKALQLLNKVKKKMQRVKLSALEFIILLKIRLSPNGISGYKLISDLSKMFAGSWQPKSGTVYPLLKRLVEDKKLIFETEEKTPLGPTVKVYRIIEGVGNSLDELILESYQQEMVFFGNYLEFMVENIEYSIQRGDISMDDLVQVQDQMEDAVERLASKVNGILQDVRGLDQALIEKLKCPACQSIIDREARFCPSCGSGLDTRDMETEGN